MPYEVIAAWNLTAANAPKNLVCVTGGIRSAILSQPTRKYWNCGIAIRESFERGNLFPLEDVLWVRRTLEVGVGGTLMRKGEKVRMLAVVRVMPLGAIFMSFRGPHGPKGQMGLTALRPRCSIGLAKKIIMAAISGR